VLADLVDLQSNVLLLSAIEGLFRDPNSPDQLRQRHSGFSLLRDRHNLFDVETLSLQRKSLFSTRGFAGNQPLGWIKNTGAAQLLPEERELLRYLTAQPLT
jgi:hypothetical protein